MISLVLGMFACKQEVDPDAPEEVLSLGDLVALSTDSMYSQVKESLADKDAAYESMFGRSANRSVIRAGETASDEPVTLKVLGFAWGEDHLDYIFDVFEETYPNVTIEKEILDGENYHNKVKAYTEENLVHVAMMGSDVRHGENWKGKQVNIKKDLESGFYHIGSFPRGDNGEIYYVPDGAKNLCSVVVINMELLNRIGGKVPENYDDLVDLAVLCESKGIDCLTAFGGTGWRWGTDIFSPIVARTTGDANWVQKVAKGNANFTDAGFVAALEAVKKYRQDILMNFIRKFTKTIDKCAELDYNKSVTKNGGIAQLARASGSYPAGRWFKSDYRYHDTKPFPNREREYGPVVKRLRHRPFTAVTRVRFSSGSPKKALAMQVLFLSKPQGLVWNHAKRVWHHLGCILRLDSIRDLSRNSIPQHVADFIHTCGVIK